METAWISAAIGGVTGAMIKAFWDLTVTTAKDRTALSLKFVLENLEKQNDIAGVNAIFDDPTVAVGKDPSAAANRNRVRQVANRYEVIAMCYRRHFANRDLLDKTGIIAQANRFSAKLNDKLPELATSAERWPNLNSLKNGN